MANYQIIRVPFTSSFPNGPYTDNAGLSIILSGDYFLATAAPEDFERYFTGAQNFFSGSGFWGVGTTGNTPYSGYSFLFTRYFANDFESFAPTGIFQSGSWLNSGVLFSGYFSPFTCSGVTGSTFGVDNIYFESFTGYLTGQNTGFFPGLFTNNYISLMRQNLGSISGFVNYNLLGVFEAFTGIPSYATGFNTGLFGGTTINGWNIGIGNPSGFVNYNLLLVFEGFSGYSTGFFFNPFGHVSLNNPNLNSGLLINGWNYSSPFTGITSTSFPSYFVNSGILSGYWNNPTGILQANFASGNINKSGISFSGGVFYYPYNANYLLNDFTVEFWINLKGWGSPFARLIEHNFATGFVIDRASGSDFVTFEVMNASQNTYLTSLNTLSKNIWTHIACVRNGNTGYFYMSGYLNNSGIISGQTLTSIDPIFIGTGGDGNQNVFTGYMDELRIWNYARSSGQINSNYNSTINPYSTGLLNYIRMIIP